MARIEKHEQEQETRLYAYMRRGEWAFGRVDSIGAEIPNMAIVAWQDGRLTDSDLICLVFASYRAKQYWYYENPYYEDEPAWADMQFRLEVYRAYKELVGTDEPAWVPVS